MVHCSNIAGISASTTISLGFDVYLVDATSGNITLTLPNISTNGINVNIRRTDLTANIVTITGTGGQLINGNSTLRLAINTDTTLNSLSSAWFTIHTGKGSASYLTWSSAGNLMSGAVNRYARPGTSNLTSAGVVANMRFNQNLIVKDLVIRAATAPGGTTNTATFTVVRNNSSTLLASSLVGANTTNNNPTNIIIFNAGDDLALRVDTTSSMNASEVIVTLALFPL